MFVDCGTNWSKIHTAGRGLLCLALIVQFYSEDLRHLYLYIHSRVNLLGELIQYN